MRITAMACAILAGTLGFSSLVVAQGYGGRGDGPREARQERRDDRRDWRQDRREPRREARQDRREWRRDQHRAHTARPYVYQAPRYAPQYNPPRYVTRSYYQRGGYLPYEYRQPRYYVSNWNTYPGLYAPPYGHQWVRVGSDFALMAIATGLIVHLLANG